MASVNPPAPPGALPDPHGAAPDAAAFMTLAQATLAALPPALAAPLGPVRIVVEDAADADTLAALGLSHPDELTGLYQGQPLSTPGGTEVPSGLADTVTLYRSAILLEWIDTGVRLDDLIRHVVIHEIGHHYGFSDDDMDAIEAGASRGPSL